ncbi:MAG: SDR family NAD(P)-dependent oxidoreductase, partial [Pseudomonadota bacterium]
LQLTRLALPAMIAKGGGHILNMGSVAGLYPINSAVYGASKGAVHLMSMNLRIELRGTGVRVTQINPGRVATEFYDAAVPDAGRRAALKETGIEELRPEDVADAVHYALMAPAHVNVSLIELQPREQSFGGVSFDRVTPR